MNRSSAGGKGSGTGRAGRRPGPGRAALAVGFAFGAAFGLALSAVAHFTNLREVSGGILARGIQLTGHPDFAEDLTWFLSGGAVGAMLATYFAWRATRRREAGIDDENVITRTFRVLEGGRASGAREESPGKGESAGPDGS